MDIVKGSIVRAKAGRDKLGYFVVMSLQNNGFAYICDGKSRPVQRQKLKKLIHLEPTGTVIGTQLETNREVREVLNKFRDSMR